MAVAVWAAVAVCGGHNAIANSTTAISTNGISRKRAKTKAMVAIGPDCIKGILADMSWKRVKQIAIF